MKILFNRTSYVVRSLEIIGGVLSAFYLRRAFFHFDWTAGFFCFFLASYLFIRICEGIDWYPNYAGDDLDNRHIGIRVHFQKALVPTSYIFAISALFALLDIPVVSSAVIFLSALMMVAVAPLNGILIYFHLRDKDPLPINYFSQNHYQEETNSREKLRASVG